MYCKVLKSVTFKYVGLGKYIAPEKLGRSPDLMLLMTNSACMYVRMIAMYANWTLK